MAIVRVEFLGISRQRAGIPELELEADTLGQLLATLEHRLPSFDGVVSAGRLSSAFRANLNGDRFVSDPLTRLSPGDCVLILSADAGG
jgi:molybdopterin converting factor small subunit